MRAFIDRVKKKHNIKSDRDFWMIFTSFSLAGMTIGFVRRWFFGVTGINHAHLWVKTLVIIFVFLPYYQLSTLVIGSILGQNAFFWERQKRLGRLIRSKLLRINASAPITERIPS